MWDFHTADRQGSEAMKDRVELLAPAGDYTAFLGAVNAGADAVYLGGEKFGARAYAQNFTAEEICRAIRTAHFAGRKVYLTVNTLVKDAELTELYAYLRPFYEEGLDGVIVQDLGALRLIREHFSGLALHASTQMTVTGCGGAAFLGGLGVERIVPARELSLAEVRRMKEETGLEIECFIHGAMCYCYSGQCLFSSILGGRSGNRGRCAQPCRLPYQIWDGAALTEDIAYPLSLKDMCTITFLPQLIGAGIDSLKIEGRMKKPEYAAGVTALYRKYIDLYETGGADSYRVSKEDMDRLRSLYIRSDIQTGYYERHNGREMVTLHKPGYGESDQRLLEEISARYLREPDRQAVRMEVFLKAGEESRLQIAGASADKGDDGGPGLSVTVYGKKAETAKKLPLQHESIRKQMVRTGNSPLTVTACEVQAEGEVFLPVSALNDLRRKGVEAYERAQILKNGLPFKRDPLPDVADALQEKAAQGMAAARYTDTRKRTEHGQAVGVFTEDHETDILVSTLDQLTVAVTFPCRRVYVDSDLYVTQHDRVVSCMKSRGGPQYALALPYVLRADDEAYLRRLAGLAASDLSDSDAASARMGMGGPLISAFLVRNLEGLAYVRSLGLSCAVVPDAGLYTFNAEGLRFWADYGREYTLPYELNRKETGRLVRCAGELGMDSAMIVYGTIPMMVTANCIRKTARRCKADRRNPYSGQDITQEHQNKNGYSGIRLRDRFGTEFPVETNCLHCYNIIYNSVPYSLRRQENDVASIGAPIWRCDFTTESAEDCRHILQGEPLPDQAYTTGHFKRGVE